MSQAVTEKGYKGIGMEGVTAKWYASLTRKSAEDYKAMARRVAAETSSAGAVLEVAPGPGYFAIELAKIGARRVTGIDISHTFVEMARRNATEAGVEVDFRHGNASAMPFPDESFDFLFCRAAFKNFSQPVKALQEMYRVLKPGGSALIIDLRKDATKQTVSEAVHNMHLSAVDTLLTKLTFRFVLLKRAYTREQFEQMLSETKFEQISIKENPLGLEVSLQRT